MSDTPGISTEPDEPQTLISHLIELRARLLRIVAAVLAVFVLLTPFANKLFTLAAQPLIDKLPAGTSMIATEVASPFLTPFKLALFAAFFITMPITLHQLWAFVAPGLYRNEKKLVMPLLVTSTLLFYGGVAFAYFVVFPVMFAFFTAVVPAGVEVMTDMNSYLSFLLTLFAAFGISFEVPIAILLLVRTGFVTPDKLAAQRPYVILAAFVIGMLLTPPDLISQTLLAVPMLLLYEVGIVLSRRIVPTPAPGVTPEVTNES